jgi:two-component system uhpT operon response regulator UhpA
MVDLKQVSVEEQTVIENPLLQLTTRELEVFRLLVDGKNIGQVALLLGVSDKTIYLHRDNLMQKLHVDNLADMVKLALKHRLISLE